MMQPVGSGNEASSSKNINNRQDKKIELKKEIQKEDISSSSMQFNTFISDINNFDEILNKYFKKLCDLRLISIVHLRYLKNSIKEEKEIETNDDDDKKAQNIYDKKWFNFSEEQKRNFPPKFETQFKKYIKELKIVSEALQETNKAVENLNKNRNSLISKLALEEGKKAVDPKILQEAVSLVKTSYIYFFSIQVKMAQSLAVESQFFEPLPRDSEYYGNCILLEGGFRKIIDNTKDIHQQAIQCASLKDSAGKWSIKEGVLQNKIFFQHQAMYEDRRNELKKLDITVNDFVGEMIDLGKPWFEALKKFKEQKNNNLKNEKNFIAEFENYILKFARKISLLQLKSEKNKSYLNIIEFLFEYCNIFTSYKLGILNKKNDDDYTKTLNTLYDLYINYEKQLKEKKQDCQQSIAGHSKMNDVQEFLKVNPEAMKITLQKLSEQLVSELIEQEYKKKQQQQQTLPTSKQKFTPKTKKEEVESSEITPETATSSEVSPEQQYHKELYKKWNKFFTKTDYREGRWSGKAGIPIPLIENYFPSQMQFTLSTKEVMAHLKKRHPELAQSLRQREKQEIKDTDGFQSIISQYEPTIHNLISEIASQLSDEKTLIYKSPSHKDAETGEEIHNPTIMVKTQNKAGDMMLSAWGLYKVEKQDEIKLHLLSYYPEEKFDTKSDGKSPHNIPQSKSSAIAKGKGKKQVKKLPQNEVKISKFSGEVAQEIEVEKLSKDLEKMDDPKKSRQPNENFSSRANI